MLQISRVRCIVHWTLRWYTFSANMAKHIFIPLYHDSQIWVYTISPEHSVTFKCVVTKQYFKSINLKSNLSHDETFKTWEKLETMVVFIWLVTLVVGFPPKDAKSTSASVRKYMLHYRSVQLDISWLSGYQVIVTVFIILM